jgi:hypothetical protein
MLGTGPGITSFAITADCIGCTSSHVSNYVATLAVLAIGGGLLQRDDSLFNDQICRCEQPFGHAQSKSLRSLEIYGEFEFGWQFDRQILRPCPLEDPVHVIRAPLKQRRSFRAV